MKVVPILPSGATSVSIYPGDRGMFEAELADALAFAESRAAADKPEALMLGAMRPGHLGREAVTLADLRGTVAR